MHDAALTVVHKRQAPVNETARAVSSSASADSQRGLTRAQACSHDARLQQRRNETGRWNRSIATKCRPHVQINRVELCIHLHQFEYLSEVCIKACVQWFWIYISI